MTDITKEKLKRYRSIQKDRDTTIKLLSNWANTYHSPSFASDGAGHNSLPVSPVEKALRDKERIEAQYAEMLEESNALLEEITEFLKTIENKDIVCIIKLHYIMGYTWAQTNREMHARMESETCKRTFYKWCEKNGIK